MVEQTAYTDTERGFFSSRAMTLSTVHDIILRGLGDKTENILFFPFFFLNSRNSTTAILDVAYSSHLYLWHVNKPMY